MSNGLVRKSYAPARIAEIAVSMLPNAVMTITGTSVRCCRMRSHSSSPEIAPMFRSVTIAS